MVLGGGANSEGFDSSDLLPQYKGVGILRGATDETPTVRTFLADADDAERILLAARTLREQAGTLTGVRRRRDRGPPGPRRAPRRRQRVPRRRGVDLLAGAGRPAGRAAARALRRHHPDAISAQVRAAGHRRPKKGRDGASTLWGVPRDQVQQAIKRREIEGKR
jgi:S-DNA-T family DNA segregation ATPase FtsK/SpoIIIE